MMRIEPLNSADLSHIGHLQPPDWNNIIPNMTLYVNASFCFPFKAISGKTIMGIGTAIVNGSSTGWLANIIVDATYRGQGIGTAITRHLMEILTGMGCKTLLLIATDMGEPVYARLGFIQDTHYAFMQGPQLDIPVSEHIVPNDNRYNDIVLAMDREITGERRENMLLPELPSAMVYLESGKVTGYYIPRLGEGTIMAVSDKAGLALLAYKHTLKLTKTVLPVNNKTGVAYLQSLGFSVFRNAARMYLGPPVLWKPEQVFSRVGGHYG